MLSITARSSCESTREWIDATFAVSIGRGSHNDGPRRPPSIFPQGASRPGRRPQATGHRKAWCPYDYVLLPAGERPERLAGGEVLGPDGHELAVLDLLDQH